MLHHIKGAIIEINPAQVVVECNDMGYLVNISLNTFSEINSQKSAFLYLHPIYKEDAQVLYGFSAKSERELFTKLISVSGVGGNTARMILSSLTTEEVVRAISSSNVAELKAVKGIGAKTAQRIIVDLKDKIDASDLNLGLEQSSNAVHEASEALTVLGYSKKQTDRLVRKIWEDNPEVTVEVLIKLALQKL